MPLHARVRASLLRRAAGFVRQGAGAVRGWPSRAYATSWAAVVGGFAAGGLRGAAEARYFFSSMALPWLWMARWILSAICASGHGSITSSCA
jgi:hypothetical protein